MVKEITKTTYFKQSELCHTLYGRTDDFLDIFKNAPSIIYNNEILIPVPYVLNLFRNNLISGIIQPNTSISLSDILYSHSNLNQITL